MRKYLFFMLIVIATFFAGCAQEATLADDPVLNEVESAESTQSVDPDKQTVLVDGSSVLADDTGYGFAYEPVNVFDLDYSTAWCPTGEDEPVLTLTFAELTDLDAVGIVPGFARDEEIFYQNNRLKTVEVSYDDEVVGELSFEDSYEMQFFDMPGGDATKVSFKITDVYPGSKYNDTCIAEVDFWSDWVETEDADAAYNYYLEYKESFSLRPVGLDSIDLTIAQALDSCGSINSSYFTTEEQSMGSVIYSRATNDDWLYSYDGAHELWHFTDSDDVAISAQMNEWAEAGDEVEIIWIAEIFIMPDPAGYPKFLSSTVAEVQECADGNLYVSNTFEPSVGHYSISLYYDGKLIGKEEYYIAQ